MNDLRLTGAVLVIVFMILGMGKVALYQYDDKLQAEENMNIMKEELIDAKARNMKLSAEMDMVRGVLKLDAGDTVYSIAADEIFGITRAKREEK